ncbi:MAG TPA: glycosyltransferase [Lachnospiraceae bacterium]|nr:glycosyltransferase [Lachnospiraceae bacterium]
MPIKTLTFYSNYYNHHQKALCDEWYRLLGDGFTFVETEPIEAFRAGMGWGAEEIPSYVLKTHEGDENREKGMRLSMDSDLVVMGTAPEEFIEARLQANKLTFRYSERPLKEGFIKFFIPRLTKKYIRLHIKNRNKRLYILAASAYTAYDYRKIRCYLDKCYKFGYFPQFLEYDVDQLMMDKRREATANGEENINTTILWAGRMLKLKRPDLVIEAAKRLRERGYHFTLTMIGEGEERKKIEHMVEAYHLADITKFIDFLSPLEARAMMAKADIYVMTSNFWEGWGSVIYEALNAGCAVVASHACGATPWLVQHQKTGLVFESGSIKSITEQLEMLLKHRELQEQYGRAAYKQMKRWWNPRVAAESVLHLAECLEIGKDTDIVEGPCSKAGILKNNWFHG